VRYEMAKRVRPPRAIGIEAKSSDLKAEEAVPLLIPTPDRSDGQPLAVNEQLFGGE
jgi:hypothetical protein